MLPLGVYVLGGAAIGLIYALWEQDKESETQQEKDKSNNKQVVKKESAATLHGVEDVIEYSDQPVSKNTKSGKDEKSSTTASDNSNRRSNHISDNPTNKK
jgi:hypothetical protein